METTSASHTKSKLTVIKRPLILLVIGILLGALLTTAIRFALVKDNAVHYHANFSLYINGQKDEFKSFTFYEEVASCDVHSADNPKVRTHMHDNKPGLVHVHDDGVTWGNFFENLGYTLGNNLIKTNNGVYITGDDGNKLTFILNGEQTDSIANKAIGNEDRLLINYGKDNDQTLQNRYKDVPSTAHEANITKDPAACAGGHELTFWNRLKHAVGVPEDD